MSDFGVSYSCYTEQEAVQNSITQLRSIYPDCPVYLVSDGGGDYSFLEKKFDNLKASMESDMRGWCQAKDGIDAYNRPDVLDRLYETGMSWIDRNKAAVDFCQKPYMLMMESDVLVRGPITIPFGSKLLGPVVNFGKNAKWRDVLKRIPGAIDCDSWGWPYIYESDAFLKVYDFVKNNDDIFWDLIKSDVGFGSAGDITTPVLFAACGYGVTYNPEITECLRNPNWRQTGHPIVHQYREFYPKQDYNGRHAGE